MLKAVERWSQGPASTGDFVGCFDLAEYLRLAEYLAVQACGHADLVFCGVLIPMLVGHGLEFVDGNFTMVAQPAGQVRVFSCFKCAVQCSAIAGGKNGGLTHATDFVDHLPHSHRKAFFGKSDPFTELNRGRAIV